MCCHYERRYERWRRRWRQSARREDTCHGDPVGGGVVVLVIDQATRDLNGHGVIGGGAARMSLLISIDDVD